MKEYVFWGENVFWITGFMGVVIMFLFHVLKNRDKSKLKNTDISGQVVILSGFINSILWHVVAAILTATSNGSYDFGWEIISVPLLSVYSIGINAFVMAVFNTIIYETKQRKEK